MHNMHQQFWVLVQALGNLDKQNVFGAHDKAMDAVLSRLQGKSDGSL